MPSEYPAARLRDIVANIDRIHAHLQGMLSADLMDAKTRDAVERCLERISEAVRKLGPDIEARHPDIPWRGIRGLGNVLRHDYDVVDDAAIQRIITTGLTTLRSACESELKSVDT